MIKTNHKLHMAIISALVIVMFSLSMISMNDKNSIETGANINENTKIEWGIKRNDNHEQPDVGENNKKILEENNGICMGNNEKKYIYLTFDQGYEAGYTANILDTLKENEVHATFFITGHYLNTQGDLVKRMLEEGHLVGNHTINHPSITDLTEEEIKKEVMGLHQSLYEKFAYEMLFFRPPKGEFSQRTIKTINELGYKTVMWSFAYADWDESNQPNKQEAKEKIVSNVHNGEIMLLHATSKTNSEILSDVIQEIKQMGYEFKNLDSFE